MGRRLEFDRDKALARATELFWKRGYLNTSLAQLLKAMKLGEGSFYNTFKSKKQLYLECLRYYGTTLMKRRAQALHAERSAKQRLGDFFDVVIEDLGGQRAPGCLISNSLTNEVLSQRELEGYIFDGFDSFLDYVEGIIAEGQEHGELSAALDPAACARIVFTYLHGLFRLSVYKLDLAHRRDETHAFIDAVLPAAEG